MPVNVEVQYVIADDNGVALFFEKFQQYLNNPNQTV